MHGNESRSRIFKCPRSIWAPQEDVIFKSDTADPVHLRCVIMHQAQRCVLTLLLMVCVLGFIFPIKSANYMIIPHYVPGHFGNELRRSAPPPPPPKIIVQIANCTVTGLLMLPSQPTLFTSCLVFGSRLFISVYSLSLSTALVVKRSYLRQLTYAAL